jgi:hypothetical protein
MDNNIRKLENRTTCFIETRKMYVYVYVGNMIKLLDYFQTSTSIEGDSNPEKIP